MGCDGYEAILKDVPAASLVRELEAHLLACPACARQAPEGHAVLLALTSSVEAAMRVEPSTDFLARVRQHVAEERARPSTRRLRWLPALAASVAIAVALVVAAAARRRMPSTVAESTPAPVPSTRIEAAGPSRGSGATPPAASMSETPAGERRDLRAPERQLREPLFGRGVLVERGQEEALARLVASGRAGPRARPAFTVTSLDAEAPLPRLAAADLPRFEMKPLPPPPAEWGPALDVEEPALDTNEGS
jgi:hypothetical protein